jgi:hypothetical protein
MSQGLKPTFLLGFDVQAKAWTYLRGNGKGRDKYGDSGFARMTSKSNGKGQKQRQSKSARWAVYVPPFAMVLRRMGHPIVRDASKEKQISSLRCGITNKRTGNDKSKCGVSPLRRQSAPPSVEMTVL